MNKVLSQEEVDAVFQGGSSGTRDNMSDVAVFDLIHLDRIPKSQLRSIHLVHENFVRTLASSLSAYLRSSVALNLVSLEQISYAEFLDGLSFPTCLAYLSMAPHEGTAVFEMNMTLMFTFVELLLGSKGGTPMAVQRKITEIEKSVMQTLMRVVTRDLSDAWRGVGDVRFAVESFSSEPQLTHVLAPGEAVIVIALDVRIGAVSGLMNLAIPSIFIKRLRHKFDQIPNVSKTEADVYPGKMGKLIEGVELEFTAVLDGGTVTTRTLLDLKPGDVVAFDHPNDQPVKGSLNDSDKWGGTIAVNRGRLIFEVGDMNAFENGPA